jgi:hypothetical protein
MLSLFLTAKKTIIHATITNISKINCSSVIAFRFIGMFLEEELYKPNG